MHAILAGSGALDARLQLDGTQVWIQCGTLSSFTLTSVAWCLTQFSQPSVDCPKNGHKTEHFVALKNFYLVDFRHWLYQTTFIYVRFVGRWVKRFYLVHQRVKTYFCSVRLNVKSWSFCLAVNSLYLDCGSPFTRWSTYFQLRTSRI